jgi:hypothetical protein
VVAHNLYNIRSFLKGYDPIQNPIIGIKPDSMKKYTLLKTLIFALLLTSLISCKKENNISVVPQDQEATFELSTGQAVADNLTEDANEIFMEAAANKSLLGSNFSSQAVITSNVISSAVVTVSPAAGFPKNITIDFGNGITSANGITHKGKINVVLSDSVRKAGSTAVITFTNYYINTFKKEGTITWTNTSTPTTKSWQRKVTDGKISAPDGRYWLHTGVREVVQIAGTLTPCNLLDDVFLITGNHTVTNAAGITRNCYITEALQKQTTCDNIGAGKQKVEGGSHYATIDFGNGDCDKSATISIDGNTPRTIQLR